MNVSFSNEKLSLQIDFEFFGDKFTDGNPKISPTFYRGTSNFPTAPHSVMFLLESIWPPAAKIWIWILGNAVHTAFHTAPHKLHHLWLVSNAEGKPGNSQLAWMQVSHKISLPLLQVLKFKVLFFWGGGVKIMNLHYKNVMQKEGQKDISCHSNQHEWSIIIEDSYPW